MAGASSDAGCNKHHSRERFLQRSGSSVLEISLHAHFRCITKEDGPRRRSARRRYSGECVVSILAGARSRSFDSAEDKRLGGIRKAAGTIIEQATRNRCDPPFRK